MTDQPTKVALITGAARGIGLATAKRFLADGWHVACLDVEDALLAASLAAIDLPERTLALQADVSKPAEIESAVTSIKARFGRLDALVNNAG
ncbi:MAG: SDR family NAD(P)-dependent oxidoreductase, partial [Bosea sp. (in: a-proteobacteria)]